MSAILLERAMYQRRARQPLAPSGSDPARLTAAFGDYLGRHLARATQGLSREYAPDHYLCSTMIDLPFSSGALDWHRLRERIGQHTAHVPQTLVNAYECASWGYVLRHVTCHRPLPTRLLCTIVDVNLLNLGYWEQNSNWGKSGFGVITLALHCPVASEAAIVAGFAKTHNAVAEFALAMRQAVRAAPGRKLAKPFFPEDITGLFLRQLPDADHLPDDHPELGHCFGADPWISIIRDARGKRTDGHYLSASTALNGYWALAQVDTVPDGEYLFADEAP
ncbi:MAG: hypothetical protein LBP86_03990 [Azoarcus sp.]|jgi:hypothetical protein|nr:hypothetical protein [Azoarcus sp.]